MEINLEIERRFLFSSYLYEMVNLLQPVLEKYSKFFIEKQSCPSYVNMYTKNKSEIVIVYAKVNNYYTIITIIYLFAFSGTESTLYFYFAE